MIVTQEKPVIERYGELKESSFSVDEEDLIGIFNVLRNSLYSDKILAIIREYLTNCYDAHVLIGHPERQAEITIPTSLNPVLRIRDFGPGLSDEGIRQIFTKYGKSTKKNSNDFVGHLGFGSKAAFAYTQNFTIISYHNGYKTTYEAYIDESKIGKIAARKEEKTEEQTGLEIVVTVNISDIQNFTKTALEFLREYLPRPVIKGVSEEQIKLAWAEEIIAQGDDWKIVKDRPSRAVMGNVSYPIDVKVFQIRGHIEIATVLANFGVILYVPLGSLENTASRESIEYRAKDIEYITRRVETILKELRSILTAKVLAEPSLWEARWTYQRIIASKISTVFRNRDFTVEYKGTRITTNELPKSFRSGVAVQRITENYYQRDHYYKDKVKLIQNEYQIRILASNATVIAWDDGKLAGSVRGRRTRYLFENKDVNAVCYYCLDTQEKKDYIFNHPDLIGAKFVDLSTVVIPKEETSDLGKNIVVPKAKAKVKIFQYHNAGDSRNAHDFWKEIDTPDTREVYVVINNYRILDYEHKTVNGNPITLPPENINTQLSEFSKNGFKTPTIYGIRDSQKVFPEGWVPYLDWRNRVISDRIYPVEKEYVTYQQMINMDHFINYFVSRFTDLPEDSLAYEVGSAYAKYKYLLSNTDMTQIRNVCIYFNASPCLTKEPYYPFLAKCKEIQRRYTYIKKIAERLLWYADCSEGKDFMRKYINAFELYDKTYPEIKEK